MSKAAQMLFAVLALATLGALILSQRLKDEPGLVRRVKVTYRFSPNGDGYRDRAMIRFVLGRPDVVTVAVVDGRGQVVRRLAAECRLPAARKVRLPWDGRTDAGDVAPEGAYRLRLSLRHAGRSIELTRAVRIRSRPRRPGVVARSRPGTDGVAARERAARSGGPRRRKRRQSVTCPPPAHMAAAIGTTPPP